MTAIMRKTENYAWYENDSVGIGATAKVYKGFNNKYPDQPAAIKIVRSKSLLMREFNVLKRINHPNIIKLLAKEEEVGTFDQEVLIMEYANGGNLLEILKQPQNFNGLSQFEFLLLLKDLSAAMKYMNDEKLIHKDLKPGNIVKFISADGQITFKLIDLGAARELEENETFGSIGGTEEYAHPDIYRRAFINNDNAEFKSYVDLWSLGVTLYQAATRVFPFYAIGGRTNREAMYNIISQKPSGVISGHQYSNYSNILWSETLPKNAPLSDGLKELLVPLIAGLFEIKDDKRWSFNDYFKAVNLILEKHIIHVFYVNECKCIELFIDKNDDKQKMIEQLRECIFKQTKVMATKQMLLLDNKDLKYGLNNEIDKLLRTTKENPIFLYDNDNTDIQLITEKVEEQTLALFNNEAEQKQIEANYIFSYEYKRRIDHLILIEMLLKKSVEPFIENLATKISPFVSAITSIKQSYEFACKSLIKFEQTSKNEEKSQLYKESLNKIKCYFNVDAVAIQQMLESHMKQKILKNQWNRLLSNKGLKDNLSKMSQNYIDCLKENYKNLQRYLNKSNLIAVEQQQKTYEKAKFRKNVEELLVLLTENIAPIVKRMTEYLSDWYKSAQAIYIRVQILENNLKECKLKLKKISDEINADENVKKLKNECFKKYMQMLVEEKKDIVKHQETLINKITKEMPIIIKVMTFSDENIPKIQKPNEISEIGETTGSVEAENINNPPKIEEPNEISEIEQNVPLISKDNSKSNVKSNSIEIMDESFTSKFFNHSH